jgi:hypothetical protein
MKWYDGRKWSWPLSKYYARRINKDFKIPVRMSHSLPKIQTAYFPNIS